MTFIDEGYALGGSGRVESRDTGWVAPPEGWFTAKELADMEKKHSAAQVADGEAPEPERGRSWRPVDLGPFLDGTYRRAEPTLGIARSDGQRLLYPGKEHAIVSEMEAGKTWLELQCCVTEILQGNHVVFIDFEECEPAEHIERMLLLGAGKEDIREHWHFVPPAETLQTGYLDWLPALKPSLAVIDGVNEGMNLLGTEIRDEKGAAQFRQRLIKPLTSLGAAVLSGDHVIKDRETRGRYALGSVHKGNAINGALFMLENAEPFGRGLRGRSHLFVTKDRPGHLRRAGQPVPKTTGKTFIGELVIDDTDRFDLTLWAPSRREDAGEPERGQDTQDDDTVYAIVADIAVATPANTRAIRARSGISKDRTADALERLVLEGRLTETTGPRNARLFTVPPDSRLVPGTGPLQGGDQSDQSTSGPGDHSGPLGTSGTGGEK